MRQKMKTQIRIQKFEDYDPNNEDVDMVRLSLNFENCTDEEFSIHCELTESYRKDFVTFEKSLDELTTINQNLKKFYGMIDSETDFYRNKRLRKKILRLQNKGKKVQSKYYRHLNKMAFSKIQLGEYVMKLRKENKLQMDQPQSNFMRNEIDTLKSLIFSDLQ